MNILVIPEEEELVAYKRFRNIVDFISFHGNFWNGYKVFKNFTYTYCFKNKATIFFGFVENDCIVEQWGFEIPLSWGDNRGYNPYKIPHDEFATEFFEFIEDYSP